MCIYVHVCCSVNVCVRVCVCVCVCVRARACVRVFDVRMFTCERTHKHSQIHKLTHSYVHACTHTDASTIRKGQYKCR